MKKSARRIQYERTVATTLSGEPLNVAIFVNCETLEEERVVTPVTMSFDPRLVLEEEFPGVKFEFLRWGQE